MITQKEKLDRTRRKRRGQGLVEGTGPSEGVERRYRRDLDDLRRMMRRHAARELFPLIRQLDEHYEPEAVQDGFLSTVASVLLGISTKITDLIGRFAEGPIPAMYAKRFVKDADEVANHNFNSGYAKAAGVPPPPSPSPEALLAAKIHENTALIKSIPERYFSAIEKSVMKRVAEEISQEELVQELKDAYNISENNAKRIARDQTGKMTAAINVRRFEAAGIKTYIWRTEEDERVRKTHAERNGREYTTDSVPFPGTEINCRCVPEGILTKT